MRRVSFLCHGDPAHDRGKALAAALSGQFACEVVSRRSSLPASLREFGRALARSRPDVAYVIDVSPAGVAAALGARALRGPRVVVDTGDAVFALARSARLRGPLGLAATWVLEQVALRSADELVVRGSFHAELLRPCGIEAVVAPDGVDLELFRPRDDDAVRERWAPNARLVVGVIGNLAWNPRLRTCYGMELIEALALISDPDVRGLIVGDGSGLARLRERARELQVETRVAFAPRVPLAGLPRLVAAMDVGISTQTDDVVGRVRTSGKLPIYLACGLSVLATRVGEASRLLDSSQLVDFQGERDPAYPRRLAERIEGLLASPSRVSEQGARNRQLARSTFAYARIAETVRGAIISALGEKC